MPKRGRLPVLVLISDGSPTDDFEKDLKDLFDQPWAKRAIRVGIAIGENADHDSLKRFINNSEFSILSLPNTDDILRKIMKYFEINSWSRPVSNSENASGEITNITVPNNDEEDDDWVF